MASGHIARDHDGTFDSSNGKPDEELTDVVNAWLYAFSDAGKSYGFKGHAHLLLLGCSTPDDSKPGQ
ncbi:hypothetical protein D3C85_1536410 [compost metagenome]